MQVNCNSLQTGKWNVCIRNNKNSAENVVSQVESRPTKIKPAATSDDKEAEELLPIAVRSLIVNAEPYFNDTKGHCFILFSVF